MTTGQAGSLLRVTARRIRGLISEGRLPARKVGRDWVINSTDLILIADRYRKGGAGCHRRQGGKWEGGKR